MFGWLLFALLFQVARAHKKCGFKVDSEELGIEQARLKRLKQEAEKGGGRKLLADSCEGLCNQCIEIPVSSQ